MPEGVYAAHEGLIAPVRERSQIWRMLCGLAIVAIVAISLNGAVIALLTAYGSDAWINAVFSGTTAAGLLLVLATFSFITLGVALAARQMQKRSLVSVIGEFTTTRTQFWRVFRLLLLLGLAIALLPPYDMGEPLTPNLAFSTWLLLLPFSVIAVLIQVSAEEILFRGFIQQSLAARFRSPLVWMVLPSALFAAGHYLPVEAGENALLIAVWSGLFGLFAADITARAGTLGPAIAMHLFNNLIALLFIAMPGSLNGLALFLLPYEMSDTGTLRAWLVVDFAVMVVTWLAARIAIAR